MTPASRSRLAAVAATLGILAAFVGNPDRGRPAAFDVDQLARTIAEEGDHVTAVELARWIRDQRPGLRVIDLRDSDEFEVYSIPTSERLSLRTLVDSPPARAATIVLVSDGGAHAAQAWVLLRALGLERVYFLRGGVYEWLSDVMNPTLARTATPSERAAFAPIAELSRYFGGTPRLAETTHPTVGEQTVDAPTPATPAAELVQRARRRGC